MNDALLVGVAQPGQHLPHDRDGVRRSCSVRFWISGRRLVPGTYSIVRYGGSAYGSNPIARTMLGCTSPWIATPSRWRLRTYCGSVGILIGDELVGPDVVVRPPDFAERPAADLLVEHVFADALIRSGHRYSIAVAVEAVAEGSRFHLTAYCSALLILIPSSPRSSRRSTDYIPRPAARRPRRKSRRSAPAATSETATPAAALRRSVAEDQHPAGQRCSRTFATHPMTKNVAHGTSSTMPNHDDDPARARQQHLLGRRVHPPPGDPAGDHRQADQPADDLSASRFSGSPSARIVPTASGRRVINATDSVPIAVPRYGVAIGCTCIGPTVGRR